MDFFAYFWLAVGGLSAIFTVKEMPYYQQQLKPWFTPPAALFPTVWSILYILMGVGAARIWKSSAAGRSAALRIYAVQLIVNFFWSVIFFGCIGILPRSCGFCC